MKKLKYLMSVVLIILAAVITCEVTTIDWSIRLYVKNHSIRLGGINDPNQAVSQIISTSEGRKFAVFAITDSSDADGTSWDYTIYYTGCSKREIMKIVGLNTTDFKTLSNGKSYFHFAPMKDYAKMIENGEAEIYVNGETVAARSLRERLDEICENTSFSKASGFLTVGLIMEFVWDILILLICVLSIYDVMSQSKDISISLVLGNPVRESIVRNIVIDSIVMTVIFGSVLGVLSLFTAVSEHLCFFVVHFAVLILINSACFFIAYRFDICQVLKGSNYAARLLNFNYGLKFVASAFVISALSFSVTTIFGFYSQIKAYRFMQGYKESSYVEINIADVDGTDDTIETIEAQLLKKTEIYYHIRENYGGSFLSADFNILGGFENGESDDTEKLVMVVSQNQFEYITECIPELNGKISDEMVTICVPQDFDSQMSMGIKNNEMLDDAIIEKYSSGQIMCLDNGNRDTNYSRGYELANSPVIICVPQALEGKFAPQKVICQISDNEFERLSEKYKDSEFVFEKSSVYGQFRHYWNITKAKITIITICTVSLLVFELVIILSIISLEYKVNAKEICIKKIMGRRLLWRVKRLIVIVSVSATGGGLTAWLIGSRFGFAQLSIVCVVTACVILIEIPLILLKSISTEKNRLVKILKGGAL